MTREEKIHAVLAFLAPLIYNEQQEKSGPAPQVTFLSATEVQIDEFPGQKLAVNKVFDNNILHNVLREIVNYGIDDERKDWECCVEELCEKDEYEEVDGDIKYDDELVVAHIYHSLRFCDELIEQNAE